MHAAQAHALRRATTAAAVITATLAAHLAGMGLHGLTVRTPFMAGLAILAATMLGRRTAAFQPRGTGRLLLVLAAFQALAHCLLMVAPWAMGLSGHYPTGPPTAGMLAAHLAATCLLTLCLVRIERFLAAAVRLIGVVRRALARPRVPRAPRRPRLSATIVVVPAARYRAATPSRGPPAAALT